jgi:diamine N-acetyltransferase
MLENASLLCQGHFMTQYRIPNINDAPALADLGCSTFREAFAPLYTPENLALYEQQSHSVDRVADQLQSPDRLYYVAEDAGVMIGYCKIGFNKTLDHTLDVDHGRRVMELNQLYVRQSALGSGVGPALMDWCIAQAKTRGYDDIMLSVYNDNPRPQRFYARYGFEHYGDTYFMVGNHRDDEYLYRLALV